MYNIITTSSRETNKKQYIVTLQNTLLNNKKNQVQTEAKLDKTCEVN